jgi:HAD superfamily hydrolase (TIGR01509 family)
MAERNVRVVCLDAMGVIYNSADDLRELLVPFVKARTARADEEIHELYRRCSRGEFSSARLWELLGVPGDAEALDAEYLSAHRLNDGALAFVERCRARGIAVACISNDISEWSVWLRRRFLLDAAIAPWVVSGDHKSRKPERLIYERLLEAIGGTARGALLVDDREPNLDAASTMGFGTVLFGGASAHHRGVGGFRQLADLVSGVTT